MKQWVCHVWSYYNSFDGWEEDIEVFETKEQATKYGMYHMVLALTDYDLQDRHYEVYKK